MSSQVMNFQFTYLRCRDKSDVAVPPMSGDNPSHFFFKGAVQWIIWYETAIFSAWVSAKSEQWERSRELKQKLGIYLEFSIRDRLKGGCYVVWLYWNFNTRPRATRALYLCYILGG